ncbi:MAG: PEGA domain-containing protein [Prolixibacteraceae bacterium]|nr:PEGA domain-containing protein [Prolixibacteraceae bacterium]
MKNQTKVIAVSLAIIFLFSACSSTTLIDSYPSNAELFLNGEAVGFTPFYMTDTKILGSCTSVKIQKENYKDFYTTICKTEEADPGAIVGGFFFYFPFLWAMKYKPTHFYKLQAGSGFSDDNSSLDQLWKNNSNQGQQNSSQEDSKIIRLDEAKPISTEEFQNQKTNEPSEN